MSDSRIIYNIYRMALNPDIIQHRPLKEEIFEALHQRIIAGIYSPGEWLRQEEIALQMGVSMTPVREALDLLAASGLAERVPYRGVRVTELTPREIVEAYGKRLLLECLCARLAARRISPVELDELRAILDELESRSSLKEMSRARQISREFHLAVARSAGDNLLYRMYSMVANAFPDWMLYEAMFHHPEMLAGSLMEERAEHHNLVEALSEGDPDLAVQAAHEHILHMGRQLVSLLGISAEQIHEQERLVIPFILQQP